MESLQKDQQFPLECYWASPLLASGTKTMAFPEIQRETYSRAESNKQQFKTEQNYLEKLQWNWTSFQTQSINYNGPFKVPEKTLSAVGEENVVPKKSFSVSSCLFLLGGTRCFCEPLRQCHFMSSTSEPILVRFLKILLEIKPATEPSRQIGSRYHYNIQNRQVRHASKYIIKQ